MNLVVRTSAEPLAVANAVRHAVREVDREIMVMTANTLDELVSAAVATPRFRTVATAALARLALGMTCLGLGGAIAYSVAQRTAEIAVRMTLGAKPSAVLALVLREWLFVTAVGGILGLLGAWASTRYLRSMLFDVAPTARLRLSAGATRYICRPDDRASGRVEQRPAPNATRPVPPTPIGATIS